MTKDSVQRIASTFTTFFIGYLQATFLLFLERNCTDAMSSDYSWRVEEWRGARYVRRLLHGSVRCTSLFHRFQMKNLSDCNRFPLISKSESAQL
mmetsp:Transcript_13861/g.33854  ORF Transcript_13861/g.33854 Transcript_13861/m.33854 type:complete len:94 (+) Transcript_13861:63-344(+)